VEGHGAPAVAAVAAIAAYFDRLGLRNHFSRVGGTRRAKNLADTGFVLVASRLCDPSSKRRTILEWLGSVALSDGVASPLLDQYYRAFDAVAEVKATTEPHLYGRLGHLADRDLTST
jgi:hypothetical protein